jgi:hypothetical protein
MTDLVGDTAAHGQVNAGKRVSQRLAAGALFRLAAHLLVLEKLPDVGQDGAGDHGVEIDGQRAPEKLLHRLGRPAGDVDDAALMLHERCRAVRDQQGEGDLLEILRGQRAVLEGLDPGGAHGPAQVSVLDPLQLGPEPLDGLRHWYFSFQEGT